MSVLNCAQQAGGAPGGLVSEVSTCVRCGEGAEETELRLGEGLEGWLTLGATRTMGATIVRLWEQLNLWLEEKEEED